MISIIAPAYNNPVEVRKLLDSIKSHSDVDFPFEAIIVDDGSSDGSIREAVKNYGFARYVKLPENRGAAAARNEGAKEAKYDSLFFVDSDTVFLSDTLRIAAKCFSDRSVKTFVGRLDIIPENEGFFPRYKAIMFNSWLPEEGHSTIFTPAVGGVGKKLFFECGGFDEKIRGATVEYVKFSYELRKRCAIIFFPELVVRVKLNSFKKALYTDFYSTMKWVTIFSVYKKFDNHCTSVEGGLGRLFGFTALAAFVPCVLYRAYLIWLLIFAFYIFLNRRLFGLILKRESFLFFLRSVLTHMILSTVTVFGGIAGVLAVMKNRLMSTKDR